MAVDAGVLADVAAVCHRRERLRFDYKARDGAESRREVEPYRLVRSGARWYLLAWDLGRDDWRSFRLDRLTPKIPTGPRFSPRPLPEGGAAAFIARSLGSVYRQATARVHIHSPVEKVADMVDAEWGVVESGDTDSCEVQLYGQSVASIARWLYAFDADFTVLSPAELRDECVSLAEYHLRVAERYRNA